jgi:transcription initiation factor TFIID subunit 7
MDEICVLRVPETHPLYEKLKEPAPTSGRSKPSRPLPPATLSLIFSSDREATVNLDGTQTRATLYDLPCILEAQKSFDNKLYHKIADIGQILILDPEPTAEGTPVDPGVRGSEEYLHPHGMTPPLKFVRKRRFRRRISKKAIEDVEREIERLLTLDAEADDVKYGPRPFFL